METRNEVEETVLSLLREIPGCANAGGVLVLVAQTDGVFRSNEAYREPFVEADMQAAVHALHTARVAPGPRATH